MNWAWIGWAFAASLAAISMETVFRGGVDYHAKWWIFVVPAVFVNYAVWRLIGSGPSLLIAVAGFNFFTLAARCGVSHFVLHESVTKGNLVAVVALLFGLVISTYWR